MPIDFKFFLSSLAVPMAADTLVICLISIKPQKF